MSKKTVSLSRAEISSAFTGALGLLLYLPLTASPGISRPSAGLPGDPERDYRELHSILGHGQLIFRARAVPPVTRP